MKSAVPVAPRLTNPQRGTSMTTLKVLEFNGVCSNELRTAQPQNACRRTPALWRKDTVFRYDGERIVGNRFDENGKNRAKFGFLELKKERTGVETNYPYSLGFFDQQGRILSKHP